MCRDFWHTHLGKRASVPDVPDVPEISGTLIWANRASVPDVPDVPEISGTLIWANVPCRRARASLFYSTPQTPLKAVHSQPE